MNTETLLAIVGPHAEMLKRMGVSIMYPPNDGKEYAWPVEIDGELSEESPSRLTRILSDVCMEWLEKWAMRESDRLRDAVCIDSGPDDHLNDHYVKITRDGYYVHHVRAPTRLAALLALCAWCQNKTPSTPQ